MNLKTYRAKTMQEALALVREELGPKASVLRTRELPARGLSRLWGSSGAVEVVASDNVTVPSRLPTRQPVIESRRVPRAHAGIDLASTAVEVLPSVPETLTQKQFGQTRSASTGQGSPSTKIDAWQLLAAELSCCEVPEPFAQELIQRLRRNTRLQGANFLELKNQLEGMIAAEIPVTGPISLTSRLQQRIALIGPTGVGKTTTLAKLAARLRLRENRQVGLITIDTYRIAAVEQLRSYAEIIGLPMEVAASAREIGTALARLSDQDVILLDTAGRNPHDARKIRELQDLLGEARPDSVQLVLSAVTSPAHLARAIDLFAPAAPTALLLTKLDEAPALGCLLPVLHRCRLPLSYGTYGQEVPSDIAPIEARLLARALLGTPMLTSELTA